MNPTTEQLDAYLKRFANRTDAFYRQWSNVTDWGYTAIYKAVSPAMLIAHLRGMITLAWPALDQNNCGKWLCIDSDGQSGDLDRAQAFLHEHHWYFIREGRRPGRDGHLWLFFDAPLPGRQLIALGKLILKFGGVNESSVEIFPKQPQAPKLGSSVRGPLGIHRKPGAGNCRGWFDGPAQDLKSQLDWLAEQPLNSSTVAMELAYKHRDVPKPVIQRSRRYFSTNQRTSIVELVDTRCSGGELLAQCPVCAEEGHDLHRDNLHISLDGQKFCCWYKGKPGKVHTARQIINALTQRGSHLERR